MDALVSGQAGVAAIIEGNSVSLMRSSSRQAWEPSSFAALHRIFVGCSDLLAVKSTSRQAVEKALNQAWSTDRATRLALIVLDTEEYPETRQEAALYLEPLLEDSEVRKSVKSQFAWAPLPNPDLIIRSSNYFVEYEHLRGIFESLLKSQATIARYHDAWGLIPDELFDTQEQRQAFLEHCINRGAFMVLVEAGEGTQQTNLAVFECYKRLRDLPNHRPIISAWTQKFLQAKSRATFDVAYEQETYDSRAFNHKREKPQIGSRQAFESAIQQQEVIKQRLRDGNITLAKRFADELVVSQLSQSGPEFAAKSLCRMAQEAKRIGLHSVQLEWAQRAADIYPEDAWAHGHAADALIQCFRLDEATRELETAETLGDVVFAKNGRARILRIQNRLSEALSAFQSVIDEHSSHAEVVFAWRGAAETLRDMWRFREALAVYEQAAKKFPDEPSVACGRAAVLLDLGQMDAAIAAYDHVLDRFGNQVVALNGRATVLRKMGNLEEALSEYQRIVELFPSDSVARCGGAEVRRLMGQYTLARDEYAAIKKDFPHISVAYSGLAESLRDLGDLQGAMDAYAHACAMFPDEPLVANGFANVVKECGDFPKALSLYDTNTQRFPFDLISKLGRANILKRLGNYSDALDAYSAVLQQWSDYAAARNAKAALLTVLGRFGEAEQLLVHVAPRTEDDWIAFHIRGMIWLKSGQVDRAVGHFTAGIARSPFEKTRRIMRNALASEKLRARRFDEAVQILGEGAQDILEFGVSNVLLFHAAAASKSPDTHKLYQRLAPERSPIVIELRDAIAERYGVVGQAVVRSEEWIVDREYEAVLLEAA
ncbi:MAG TPA: tetratricopeptide repeat protein [Microvirga sp.]|jgi:tetratricopeptide (TPR) repeat protein|nr:tetratricopeptide repeat protein [Microvirga sp.]